MGSIGYSPKPSSSCNRPGAQKLSAPFACRNKFAALNPDRLMVFTAETQFWCLSDTALRLVLQSNSLLATPLSFFGKAKFALVIKKADTAGTEALTPQWAKHLTFSSYCPSWVPITVGKKSLKAFSTSSLWAIASRLYIWLDIFCIFFGLGFFSLPLSYSERLYQGFYIWYHRCNTELKGDDIFWIWFRLGLSGKRLLLRFYFVT